MPPTFFAALGLGVRAVAREPWLLAVGLLVSLVRRAATWPAWAVAWAVLVRGATLAAARHPLEPLAPLRGVEAAITSPRLLALVAGLWAAGLALGAVLRVAYVAGALPTLGAAMAGASGPRFASGIAYGFPRVLGASALGLALDAGGGIFGATLALAALRITSSAAGSGASPLLAAAVAFALTVALAVPAALSTVSDAAVARAAVRADHPAEAFVESGARFLRRPGTFLLAALAFGAAGVVAPGLLAGAGSLATGFARLANPVLELGPRLMLGTLAAALAAAVDLVWLATVAALACGEAPAPGARVP